MAQRWNVKGNVRYTNDKGEEVSRWLAMPKALEETLSAQAFGYTNISLEVDWEGARRVQAPAPTPIPAVVAPTVPVARAKKQKPPSRRARWEDAAGRAVAALEELEEMRGEFESWRDNLPENLQQSALGEKLDTVADLDISTALETAQEAEGADLPMGFGRD